MYIKKSKVFNIFILAVLFIIKINIASAVTPKELLQQQNNSQQQEQQRLQQQRHQLEIRESQRPQSYETDKETNRNILDDKSIKEDLCFDIKKIEVKGVESINKKEIENIVEEHQNKCINLNIIKKVVHEISEVYYKKGFVTTKVTVPEQNLSHGVFILKVVEGKLDQIKVEPESDLKTSTINRALPKNSNETLNLRDIEQSIDNINRLQSYQVSMQVEPGNSLGQSDIVFANQQQSKPYHIQANINNSGQEENGELQGALALSLDNILGLAEYIYLNYQEDLETEGQSHQSKSYSMHVDIPYGYWLFDIDSSYFRHHNKVKAQLTTFDSNGRSRYSALGAKRLIYRDQDEKIFLQGRLRRNEVENYINQTEIEASSRVITAAELNAIYEKFVPQGRWYVSVGVNRGLRWLGAEKGKENKQDPQFDKYLFRVSYHKNIKLKNQQFRYQLESRGQYSDDVLYSSEQLSIGGLYSIRGYDGESLYGNTGALLRQDLFYVLPFINKNSLMGNWLFSVGLDAGVVKDALRDFGHDKYSRLRGWGYGLHTEGGRIKMSLQVTKPSGAPYELGNRDEYVDFNIAVDF